MYRVFLIDDEPWVMMGLERLIDWETLGFRIEAKCENARSAWERIQKEKPDVVLSDIRMPGLSGLELLRLMREAELPVEVVLVSAFADFSYAQAAIRSGAFEYLLKPVQREQLAECMKKLAERLDTRKATHGREENARRREILSASKTLSDAMLALTGDAGRTGTRAAVVCAPPLAAEWPETLPGVSRAVSIELSANETLLLCAFADDGIGMLSELTRVCEENKRVGAFGLCRESSSGDMLDSLIWHARIARQTAAFAGRPGFSCNARDVDYDGKDALLTAAHYGQRAIVAEQLALLERAVLEGRLLLDRLTMLLWRMDKAYSRGGPSLYPMVLNRYTDLLQCYPDCEALFSHLNAAFAVNPEDAAVSLVMDEINLRFASARTLSDLAAELAMSQAGLSQIIRRQTGRTYSELLQEKRMDMARELLTFSNETVLAIAERTGYADQFYFSKLFKKLYGVSPNAYRKKTQPRDEITKSKKE